MKFNAATNDQTFAMDAAILLYADRNTGYKYATLHSVSFQVDDRPCIDAGRPMTEKDFLALVKGLAPKSRPEMEWLDTHVLARGLGKTIWWSPPTLRSMFFKTSSAYKGTFDGSAVCPVPGLVWIASQHDVYVYAVKGAERPNRETRLYQAPFFNVWAKGQVCVGSAMRPDAALSEVPAEWEKMFFGSYFTHPNFTEKNRLIKGVNPLKFWKDMIKQPLQEFPEGRLVGLNLTVANLIETDFASKLGAIRAQGEF
jgi:hypothetical protein